MATCFIIQPFDSAKFDQRFEEVFKPALKRAGLKPYRVDQDPGVEIPIEAIEREIVRADICLADISTNNPNVWYELGYALAANRPVVLICSHDRGAKFPFDIQHRTVIRYRSDSPSDFEKLEDEISERAEALLTKTSALKQAAEVLQTAPIDGLNQLEVQLLDVLAAGTAIPDSGTSLYVLEKDVIRCGLTSIGFGVALRRLIYRSFIEIENFTADSDYGETDGYDVARITVSGWKWIEDNKSLFVLQKGEANTDENDEGLPF